MRPFKLHVVADWEVRELDLNWLKGILTGERLSGTGLASAGLSFGSGVVVKTAWL